MSVRSDVRRWRDPSWWRGWNDLTVSDDVVATPLGVHPDTPGQVLQELRTEGWTQLERPYQGDIVERLHSGVLALRERRLPAVFIWAFDETWLLYAGLDPVWRTVLGDDYRYLPCFWAWYIPPNPKRSGWPPHRDRSKGPPNVAADGTPRTMTAWIPLSRATPANGCMYVVPAPFGPMERDAIRPQDARALPAAPGDVLMWRQDVWHWGGRSSKHAEEPRISIGLEFQSGTDVRYHGPLLHPTRLPSLDHRLALIGANILRYKGFVKNDKLPPLGRELVRAAPDLDHGRL